MTGVSLKTGRRSNELTRSDNLRKILLVLCDPRYTQSNQWLSATAISRLLFEQHGVRIHWRTIDSLLGSRRDLVDRHKTQRHWLYAPLTAGRNYVGGVESSVLLVDPTKALESVVSLHGSLAALTGSISICDPYLDDVTVEHLDSCPHNSTVRLLTQNVRDTGKLRRLVAATHISGPGLQVRVSSSGALHDRYIIDDQSMLILGSSLNGFGKKQSFVIRVGQDVRQAMSDTFNTNWNTGTPWPGG